MTKVVEQYNAMWDSMRLRPERMGSAMAMAQKVNQNRARYQDVSEQTGVPWTVIGLIHARESSCDFKTHLHNGDKLTARTHHIPRGRPVAPPANGKSYTWEESAIDAIRYDKLDLVKDWSSAGIIAKEMEEYNGLGYQSRGLPSPYLWAGSDHYVRGKFREDGAAHYDPSFVDPQSGCMTVLKCLTQMDPALDPEFKPVVVADPLPSPNPVSVAAKSKTAWATFVSALMMKLTAVTGAVCSAFEWALGVAPDIKSEVDQHVQLMQSIATTARVDWDVVGAWIGTGLLIYAISRHVDLKNWLHGAKEIAQ